MPARKQEPAFAVLTADLVSSRKLTAKAVESRLGEVSKLIELKLFRRKKTFEFFRGDSFQALLTQPEKALHLALLWRAAMKATLSGARQWDVRIAIGIGTVTHQGKTLAASGGPAFQQSGTLLDSLKHNDTQRIAFHTPDEAWNETLNTECILAEQIISRWTPTAAETVFQQFLYDETQQSLAKRLGIAQSSVHKRLQTAGWPAIRHWEEHYRRLAAQPFNPQPKA
jgi:DNA-directed RNA polymerase specialized sigma24 family protein